MKKLILLGLASFAVTAAHAGGTNLVQQVTYTNGLTVTLPVSDQQYQVLLRNMQLNGDTRRPTVAATSYFRLTPNPQVMQAALKRQQRIQSRLTTVNPAKLAQIEAILNQP